MMLFSRLWNIILTFWTFLFGSGDNTNEPNINPTRVPSTFPIPVPVMAPVKKGPSAVPVKVPVIVVIPVNPPKASPIRGIVPSVDPVVQPPIPTIKSPTTTRTPSKLPSKLPISSKPTRGPSKLPSKVPSKTPVVAPISTGKWIEVDPNATLFKRHEACFVMVKGLAYLLGGRGRKVTDVYEPTRKSWISKTGPPIELHHTQCVAVPNDDQIYIVSAWTGGYPMERNVDSIYVSGNIKKSLYCCLLNVSCNFVLTLIYFCFWWTIDIQHTE